MSARLARSLVWMMALLPLGFFVAGLGGRDFGSIAAIVNVIGRLTGVLGLAFLLLAAALSARVPGVDQPFGGLLKLWKTHHLLGAACLLLLLAHPLLLAFSASAYGRDLALSTLVPPASDLAVWAGWAALGLLMIFLAPSFRFFGPPNYERWKKIHALAGPAAILALVHTFSLSRTMPAQLDILIWSLFALFAITAMAWRFVFSRRVGQLPHTVVTVDRIANNVVELTLEPRRHKLHHHVGNFVYLTPLDPSLDAGYGEEHPYALSSSPMEPHLRVAIKDLGDASRALQSIQPGSEVRVEGPYGRFFPPVSTMSELWIAGGIGITPFLARMRHLKQLGKGADVQLIYAVQDQARSLYADELQTLAEAIAGFEMTLHYFYREGPISADFIGQTCPDLDQREVYICGPLPLNQLVQAHLRAAGVPRSRIHAEDFELL